MKMSLEDRFWSKVDKSGDCWIWLGGKDWDGYGMFWYNGRTVHAQRISYLLEKGELIENLVIDHICDNPSCVNPNHLRQVTNWENTLRSQGCPTAINFRKTHCIRGHPLKHPNLTNRPGRRICLICTRISKARWQRESERRKARYDRAIGINRKTGKPFIRRENRNRSKLD